MVRPVRSSCATRQTTSGRSPGFDTNSKSTAQTSSNLSRPGSSRAITGRPLQEQWVLGAVDQPALVAEGKPEDFGRLQFRPDRLGEASGGRRVDPVALVRQVAVKPKPSLHPVDQANFLG